MSISVQTEDKEEKKERELINSEENSEKKIRQTISRKITRYKKRPLDKSLSGDSSNNNNIQKE